LARPGLEVIDRGHYLCDRALIVAAIGVAAVFWSQFIWVRATNFHGTDEWVFQWVAARGILGSPYSNRPFNFLWTIPGAHVGARGFAGFHAVHGLYLLGSALVTLALCHRLLPESPRLGFLIAVLAAVWAPSDYSRLATVQMTVNSGFTFGALIAMWLYVASWQRRSRLLLVLAAAWALLMIRGYEAVAPLIFAAPLLLVREWRADRRAAWRWLAAWAAAAVAAAAAVLPPLLHPDPRVAYQATLMQIDAHPARMATRLAQEYRIHLLPALTTSPTLLRMPAALISGLLFALAFLAVSRTSPPETGSRRGLFVAAALGLALAAFSYSAFLPSLVVEPGDRTEILAMPAIGLFLAAVIALVASTLPHRWRSLAMGTLAAWIVAVAAVRTVQFQRSWDGVSYYGRQLKLLGDLIGFAPRLRPHTLIVLVGDTAAFPATFAFRHAVECVYPGEITGVLASGPEALYVSRLTSSGIDTEPWPVLWKPWGVSPTHHRFDEMIVARARSDGTATLEESWPADLPPLPPGQSYDPRARILDDFARDSS
jgi:MFS family permease